jgi:competence protein ComEC
MTLAWLAAAWIAGIAASATFGGGAWPLTPALAGGGLAAATVARDRRTALVALACAAVFAAALWHERPSAPQLPGDALAHYNGSSMAWRGVVRDDSAAGETTQSFAMTVDAMRLRGKWTDASGGVLVRTRPLPPYQAGDVVEVEGALEAPGVLDGFDYGEYLAQRGVHSVSPFPRVRVAGFEEPPPWRAALLGVRRSLSRGLTLALPEPEASLAQGVLLGERSSLSPELRAQLDATNTSHLVVVSGQNVIYVSSFVTMAFAWVVGRRRALVLSVAVVVAYACLVGLSPPVMRATLMGVLLVMARVSGRRTSGITSILLAAAIMAGIDPRVLRDVSFQLSFAATTGIAFLASPLRDACIQLMGWLLRRDEVPRPLGTLVADPASVTVAAVIATAPLLALHFGRVSLVAVPANMLIVPAFPFVLGASLLAAIGGLVPHLHVALGAPAVLLLSYWGALAAWFASMPAASAHIGGYDERWALASYLAVAAAIVIVAPLARGPWGAMLAPSKPLSVRRAASALALCVPAVTLLGSAAFVLMPEPPARLRVVAFDVGQGDAILVESPRGQRLLIDGGPGRAVLRELGDELPWHDRSIDALVLTHAQADHGTGLVDVLARYDVGRLYTGAPLDGAPLSRALDSAANDRSVPAVVLKAGDAIDLGDGLRVRVLWPTDDTATHRPNDRSLVLRLDYGDVSFLFASDIELAAEDALLRGDRDELDATVLKVGHHGSDTSSSAAFLRAVSPAVAVISAGVGNRFGHPAPAVVERLEEHGRVYNTLDGRVRIETDGERLWITR